MTNNSYTKHKKNNGIKILTILIAILLLTQQISHAQTYSNIIPDSLVDAVLNTAIHTKQVYENDTKAKNQKAVYSQFIEWNEYAFHIPDSIFPKNEKALLTFIQDAQGIYHNNYVFRDAAIDNALTYADKQYMLEQSTQCMTDVKWDWRSKEINFIKKLTDKKYTQRYAYTVPVFSKDGHIAIIQKNTYTKPTNCKKCEDVVSISFHYFTWDAADATWKYMGSSTTM